MDFGEDQPTIMASILHSHSSASADKSQFHYTCCYSEENVYLLCKKLCADGVADLSDLFVVFISNDDRLRKKEGESEYLVWDLDSALPFPSTLASYVSECIRPSLEHLFSVYQRIFRVVHAPLFLSRFASDRSHWKNSMGNWIMPPPEYKPIVAQDGTVHSVNQYIKISAKDVLKDVREDSVNAVYTKQLGVVVDECHLEQLFSCIPKELSSSFSTLSLHSVADYSPLYT